MICELLLGLQKFSVQISHTIQQVNGEVKLNIPPIEITDPNMVIEDFEVSKKSFIK
jgi:hypothetical protein